MQSYHKNFFSTMRDSDADFFSQDDLKIMIPTKRILMFLIKRPNQHSSHGLLDVIKVNQTKTLQFCAIFKFGHLQNGSSGWVDFFGSHKWYETQELVSNNMMKLYSFLSYLTLNILQRNSPIDKYHSYFRQLIWKMCSLQLALKTW